MKILLLGKTGLLGGALFSTLEKQHQLLCPSHEECDVTNTAQLRNYVASAAPDCVINAAGYTSVDKAEEEPEKAFNLNEKAVNQLARIVASQDIPLVHFSTDYVFDGTKKEGYSEFDSTAPLSVYGASKAAGERAILNYLKKYYLIRTSWLYGPDGKNFVDTMLRLAEKGKPISVVNDQWGNPTYAFDLAQAVLGLLNGAPYGIYHIVNTEDTTWYTFALEIFKQLGVPQKVTAITSEELNRKAGRPRYSMLRNTKLLPLRSWKEALSSYLMHKTMIL